MATSSIHPVQETGAGQVATARHDPKQIAFIRRVFRGLSATSPAGGAWLAEQLFCTPRRHTPPPFEREIRAEAVERFAVVHKGMHLDALAWGSGQRVVLLAHGWEGRGAQLGRFVGPLVARGFRVVTFDGPAHGRSPGRQTDLRRHSRVFQSVAEVVGPVHGVVAHSFGGAACLMGMALDGFNTDRVALIGTPASILYPLGQFRKVVGLPENIWVRLLKRMERRLGLPTAQASIGNLHAGLRVPALVVHCQDDNEVEYLNAEQIHAAWPEAERMDTTGLGHRRILKDPAVIERVADFMAE